MKRFHVHVQVHDLARSIHFHSKPFGAEPTRLERDDAKWMLDDPRLNFAISTRGRAPGVDHLGLQAETDEELAELKARAEGAELAVFDPGETNCCYARSEKHWITEPQGIAWEHFRTFGSVPVYGDAGRSAVQAAEASACCAPAAAPGRPVEVAVKAACC